MAQTDIERVTARVAAAWFEDGLVELAAAAVLLGAAAIFFAAPALPDGWAAAAGGLWVFLAIGAAGRWVIDAKWKRTAPRTGMVTFRRRPYSAALATAALAATGAWALGGDAEIAAPLVATIWAAAFAVMAWKTRLPRLRGAALLAAFCALQTGRLHLDVFLELAIVFALIGIGLAILGAGVRARYVHVHPEVV